MQYGKPQLNCWKAQANFKFLILQGRAENIGYRARRLGRCCRLTIMQKDCSRPGFANNGGPGVEIPKVQSRVLELIKSRQPLPIMTRMTLALHYLGLHITQLGDSLILGGEDATLSLELLAETESQSTKELLQLLHMLKEAGFVQGFFPRDGGANVRPTVAGWQELDNLKRPRTDSAQAFVAMWFNELTTEAYTDGIERALPTTAWCIDAPK